MPLQKQGMRPLDPVALAGLVGLIWIAFKLVLEAIYPFREHYNNIESSIGAARVTTELVTLYIIGFDTGPWGDAVLVAIAQAAVISCIAYAGQRALNYWRWRKRNKRRMANQCPQCGYDLRGTVGHCPECGWSSEGSPTEHQ